MELFGRHIPFTKVKDVSATLPKSANIQRKINFEQTLHRTRQDIGTWRAAVLQAESLQYPNRVELYRLYKDVMNDAHLTGLINTRKYAILQSEYKVIDKADKEIEDKSELIHQKWFYDFIDHAMDSLFYGFSLVQFGALQNDVFSTIDLVPRQYVKQEFDIVVETPSAITGENFLDGKYKGWVIGVGNKRDLGLLAKAAPYVLWKKGAMQAWAEYTEIFGTPIRIGKTDVRDEVTRSNMEGFLKNMGVSAYGVFDTNDLIELVESNRTDAFDVFDKMIERCNSELSKLILGQTGTTDEKAYAGSSNVHERVLKMYAEQDEMYITNILNLQLIPLLNYHGLGFEGLRIESEEEDKFSYEEKAKIDLELLKYYDIDPKYIEETYGTPVIKKEVVESRGSVASVKNKLDEYYS